MSSKICSGPTWPILKTKLLVKILISINIIITLWHCSSRITVRSSFPLHFFSKIVDFFVTFSIAPKMTEPGQGQHKDTKCKTVKIEVMISVTVIIWVTTCYIHCLLIMTSYPTTSTINKFFTWVLQWVQNILVVSLANILPYSWYSDRFEILHFHFLGTILPSHKYSNDRTCLLILTCSSIIYSAQKFTLKLFIWCMFQISQTLKFHAIVSVVRHIALSQIINLW